MRSMLKITDDYKYLLLILLMRDAAAENKSSDCSARYCCNTWRKVHSTSPSCSWAATFTSSPHTAIKKEKKNPIYTTS